MPSIALVAQHHFGIRGRLGRWEQIVLECLVGELSPMSAQRYETTGQLEAALAEE